MLIFDTEYRKPFDSNLPAVNVGKKERPIWYPQEFLRIVPYQIYTDEVPHHLTAHMVNEACRDPAQSRNLIETEGLRSLGFVSGRDSSSFVGVQSSLEGVTTGADMERCSATKCP